jgi:hypothetical protein
MSEYYLIKEKSLHNVAANTTKSLHNVAANTTKSLHNVAANTTKSQGKNLFLLKERAILHYVTNKRLYIVVRNSSGVDKFYIIVQANWTCKLTVI